LLSSAQASSHFITRVRWCSDDADDVFHQNALSRYSNTAVQAVVVSHRHDQPQQQPTTRELVA